MSCLTCGFETKNPKFCSKSCSAKYNNKAYPKRCVEGHCRRCSSLISSTRTYCKSCWDRRGSDVAFGKVQLWINGEWSGGSKRKLSNSVRNFLLKESNYLCSKCGFGKKHPDDGNSILEINHIDGDGTNHSKENLEVLCPNCHALTSSYRGRNYGNGRPTYYLRVEKDR